MTFGVVLLIFGVMTFQPMFFILGLLLIFLSNGNNTRNKDKINEFRRQGRYKRYGRNQNDDVIDADVVYTTAKTLSEDEEKSLIDAMNNYFERNDSYTVTTQLNIRARREINSIKDMDVYFENTRLCSLYEFSQSHPSEYNKIIKSLLDFSNRKKTTKRRGSTSDEKGVARHEVKELSKAEQFARKVDDLNNQIPDYRISLKLDRTAGLLRQIGTLQAKGDGSDLSSVQKLYEYYMPMLVDILESFNQLQNQTMHQDHDATVEKVSSVIDTINDSMVTIVNEMNDEDFINLNADLNTLETLLKNDGLVTDAKLDIAKSKAMASANNTDIKLTLEPTIQEEEAFKKDEEIKLSINDKIDQINDTIKTDSDIKLESGVKS